jgi:MFS family permease
MTVFGAGSLLGGPTAGWLIDTYGWPLSFWVQLPIALFCMLMVSLLLPPSAIPPTHKTIWSGLASLDWLGSGLLIGSVTTLILGFSFHTSFLLPWRDGRVWGNLVAAAVAFTALLFVESRVDRPVVPLGLFSNSHVAACMASGFFLSVVSQAFVSHDCNNGRAIPRQSRVADLSRCTKCMCRTPSGPSEADRLDQCTLQSSSTRLIPTRD